jgi:4-hydroxybenzoate polyprenyltransferase
LASPSTGARSIVLWLLAGYLAGTHLIFFMAVVLASLQMAWQVTTMDTSDAKNCLRRFRSNRDVGLVIFLGLAADMILSRMAGLS